VQNKVLHLDREYSTDELQHAANFLNQQFAGQDVDAVREHLINDLENTRQDVDAVMKTAVEVASKALSNDELASPDFIVQGEKNLVRYNDNADREQLQHLFEIFDRKREMLGVKCWVCLIVVFIMKASRYLLVTKPDLKVLAIAV
jgi:heat-inducible transcriptional repressor